MTRVTYRVVEHDGGWAYEFDGSYSETFATKDEAKAAAKQAAAEQQLPGETEFIEFEDADGRWHHEVAAGADRPETDVAVQDDP